MTDGSSGYGLQAGEGERLEMLGTEQVVLAGASTGALFMVLARGVRPTASYPR